MIEPVTHETGADGISIVRLNRPDRLNAVNNAVRSKLIETLGALNASAETRAIVITAAGDRAFSAGQDLEESSQFGPVDVAYWQRHMGAFYQSVRALDKGCVVAFNGVAAGAGFQIGLCADLRVGYPEMKIGQPEVKAGFASIMGSYLMSLHVGIGINQHLSLTGTLIDGQRAYEVGLLTHLVNKAEVLGTAMQLARELAAIPPNALRTTKERFRQMTQPGFDKAVNAGARFQLEAFAAGEPQIAQKAFLEARRR